MFWIIYELSLNLFEGFLYSWFFRHILTGKKKGKSAAFWCFSLLTAAAYSLYMFLPMPSWDTWILLFPSAYALFFFEDRLPMKLFWIMCLVIAANGAAGISYHIFAVLFDTPVETLLQQTFYRIVFTLGANGLLLLILGSIVRLFAARKEQPYHISVLLTAGFICAALTDIFFILSNEYHISAKWLFMGCGFSLLLGVLTVYIFFVLSNYTAALQNYRMQERMLETNESQIHELQAMYNQMLKLQHDMNAHIRDLKNLSDASPEKYLSLLEERLHPIPSTGNPVLDSVLSTKYYKMEAEHIELRRSNLHYTGGMNITDVALCSLVSNMLDNAIEALVQAGDKIETPYVYLGFSYSNAGLMILCENPVIDAPPVSGSFFSRKKEPGHGLGMVIMQRIASDAHGQIDFINNGEHFKVVALIPPAENHE